MLDRVRRALLGKQNEAIHVAKLAMNLRQVAFERPLFPDGNAASPGLLYTLMRSLWQARPHALLEFGSGLTTELIAHYLEQHEHAQGVTLENDAEWYARITQRLSGCNRHRYLHRPLVGDPPFYDMADLGAERFDFVLIDGPVADRRGTLDALPGLLDDEFLIVVDDVHKPDGFSGIRFAHALRRALGRNHDFRIVRGVKDQMMVASPGRVWALDKTSHVLTQA